MLADPARFAWIVAAVAVALALAQALGAHVARRWARGRLRGRMDRARRGEDAAAGLLASRGYLVLAHQVAHAWTVHVDERAVAVPLRADYLVTRGGRRYVAEVKTGRAATQIENPATRRQLLEYARAFDVHGVLLVDAETCRIHHVRFPDARGSGGRSVAWAIAAFVAGACAAVIALSAWAAR